MMDIEEIKKELKEIERFFRRRIAILAGDLGWIANGNHSRYDSLEARLSAMDSVWSKIAEQLDVLRQINARADGDFNEYVALRTRYEQEQHESARIA